MKTNEDLKLGDAFSLLLLGEFASGKTTLTGNFPEPFYISNDQKLECIRRFFPNKRFWYNDPNVDTKDIELPTEAKWERFLACCVEAFEHKDSRTVVIDGLTRANDWLQAYLISQPSAVKDLVIGGQKCMTQNHWYPFSTVISRLLAKLKTAAINTKKHLIITAHVRTVRDETTGSFSLKPMVGGATADTIGSWFTDVWLLLNESITPDAEHPDGVRRTVLTTPQPRIQLCCSRKLPSRFEFTWPLFAASKP